MRGRCESAASEAPCIQVCAAVLLSILMENLFVPLFVPTLMRFQTKGEMLKVNVIFQVTSGLLR